MLIINGVWKSRAAGLPSGQLLLIVLALSSALLPQTLGQDIKEDNYDFGVRQGPFYSNAATVAALEALYLGTGGIRNWHHVWGWMANDPCTSSWYGITCEEGEVVRIELYQNNLIGTIPTEAGYLTSMRGYWDFYSNHLTGTIPTELGLLTAMTDYHNFRSNEITGTIPTEVGMYVCCQALCLFGGRTPSQALMSSWGSGPYWDCSGVTVPTTIYNEPCHEGEMACRDAKDWA